MPTVFFYISGHGFGHAVRQITVINALSEVAPDLRVIVRTTAPAWLFERTIRGTIELLPGETDTGVVQIDSLQRPGARISTTLRRAHRAGSGAAASARCGARGSRRAAAGVCRSRRRRYPCHRLRELHVGLDLSRVP